MLIFSHPCFISCAPLYLQCSHNHGSYFLQTKKETAFNPSLSTPQEELLLLEQQVRRNVAEMEEEEFWQNELLIEQESERQLRQKLGELQAALRDCEAKLDEYIGRVQVRGDAPEMKKKSNR